MSAVMEPHRPAAQKLPVLNNIVNPQLPEEPTRDSAYFSCDASSKHTSAASFGMNSALSPALSGYHSSSPADKTPSPTTTTSLAPHHAPLVSPSASNMSVASMVSPTTPGSSDIRRFERPTSLESGGPGSANLTAGEPEAMSRRESVDSRINQGFNDMRLGNSPYASHNQSTTSIQNTLNTQRNPRPGLESLQVNRISNGYQPSADRNPEPGAKVIRTAPTITGPTTSTIARAAEPTKGQAWAFPEDDAVHRGGAAAAVGPQLNGGTFLDSRRSSIADSLASSQFTSESRLPPGQRRLDEPPPDYAEYNRLSSTSGEFPSVHHHSLQQKALSIGEDGRPSTAQPYSRTPESRQSHKMAERKRRTEMKELFDQLRDLMPQERGSKASKWEILTKAITEYQRQHDQIRALNHHCQSLADSYEGLRRELQAMRLENSQLRESFGNSNAQAQQQQAPAAVHAPAPAPAPSAGAAAAPPAPPPSSVAHPPVFSSDPFGNSARPELPPLRSLSNSLPGGPDSMTGVQYEPPRTNGFRNERY